MMDRVLTWIYSYDYAVICQSAAEFADTCMTYHAY